MQVPVCLRELEELWALGTEMCLEIQPGVCKGGVTKAGSKQVKGGPKGMMGRG